ncbi:MAG: TolC family protein, partial [Lutibacter sp.]
MRLKNVIFLTLLFISIFINKSQAQNVRPITLNEILSYVAKNNYDLKISNEEFKSSKADLNQSNAIFLPSIAVSHTGISTTNPLMAFGSKLNQEILTPADFDPSLLNNPRKTQNFATKIEVKQPILNFDGFLRRKAAKSKMNAFKLKDNRSKKYINLEVKKAFMQLQLAYKSVIVINKALEAGKANLKMANDNFKQGYLQKADLLAVKIRVTEIENQLETAKNQIKNASDYIYYLMGEQSGIKLKPKSELIAEVDTTLYENSFNENRDDIVAMQKSEEAYKYLFKASKRTYLPKLNAFGSYELYDSKLFGTQAKGYLVGAQLSWDVFNGFKRIGKIQKNKAEFEKAQINLEQYKTKSNLEFNKAIRQLKSAERTLKLKEQSVSQSKEALRIRTNRFKQGLEKTSDLLMAEAQSLKMQLAYYQSV